MNICEIKIDSASPIQMFCEELVRDLIDIIIVDNESKDQRTLVAEREGEPAGYNTADTTISSLCEELVSDVIDRIIVDNETRTATDSDGNLVIDEIRCIIILY